MDEKQWLACNKPHLMLEFLVGKTSDRKLRLFAVACCSRIKHLLDTNLTLAVSATERFADGLASEEDLSSALARLPEPGGLGQKIPSQSAVWWACQPPYRGKGMAAPASGACGCVVMASIVGNRPLAPGEVGRRSHRKAAAGPEEDLCHVLRDVIGNPFRPLLQCSPSLLAWNEGTVRRIAQAVYDEKAFDRLPILSDALEDAGCTDVELLGHLRSAGPHVRGCWVVDLLIGKS